MLCTVCTDALCHQRGWFLDDAIGFKSIRLAHHESVAGLESSAKDACEICYPFWHRLSEDKHSRLKAFDTQWTSERSIAAPRDPGHRFEFIRELDGFVTTIWVSDFGGLISQMGLTISLDFVTKFFDASPLQQTVSITFAVHSGPAKDLMKMTPFLSTNTGSEEAWAKACSWIRKCTSTHQACNAEMRSDPWYPTRLLDLSAFDGSLSNFRLITTSEMGPDFNERYATLSHCWGSAQFLQLKRSTVADLKKGVPVSKLPKSFRHAIKVTRKLGLRLLWIDSLCIFQDRDDLSDWLVEAGLMHKVYSHSFCNISAAGAVDSSKGLFFDRDQRLSLNAEVRICIRGLGLGVDSLDCRLENRYLWNYGVERCPLNERGWVLQERFLAPRVLHFGRDQLFWECREHATPECYPDAIPQPLREQFGFKPKRVDAEVGLQQSDDPIFYYRQWNFIILAYTNTRLTKSSDKLIALSGIAKRFSTLINDTYVVGMWRKHLVSQLLWYVKGHSQADGYPSTRPQPYRAPSFSWTSVDGSVYIDMAHYADLQMEVTKVQLDYVSADTTSLVKGGYIHLRGDVRPFDMIVRKFDGKYQLFMQVNGTIIKDSRMPEWQVGPHINLDVWQENFDMENEGKLLYYMISQKPPTDNRVVAYLLFRCVDRETGSYERIGVAVAGMSEEFEMLSGTACRSSQDIPCVDYTDGLYTIQVI